MKNILARANREILREFVWSNVLLAFDYDGTLAPIVADPERALMRRGTQHLFRTVTKLYPVVVISGRSQKDARSRLPGGEAVEVIGNHGIESRQKAHRYAAEVRRWLPALGRLLSPQKGVVVEDKVYSVAIHYRGSRNKKEALAAIRTAADSLGRVRVMGGRQVVNILPYGAPHKGMALDRERERLRCDTAIYIGDDETDEDVFQLNQPGQLLSIRVGSKRESAAPYYVANQNSVDEFLQILIDLRRESARLRGGR